MKTVKDVAEKYNMKKAWEQTIINLTKRVENLENEIKGLKHNDYHDDAHRAYGAAIMEYYGWDK